jgi:hypothetical protein
MYFENLDRPCGIFPFLSLHPQLKLRAIFRCSCGTQAGAIGGWLGSPWIIFGLRREVPRRAALVRARAWLNLFASGAGESAVAAVLCRRSPRRWRDCWACFECGDNRTLAWLSAHSKCWSLLTAALISLRWLGEKTAFF